jgi:hypothetical protein
MNWRGGTGQVIDLIDFQKDWLGHIMSHQFKARVVEQVHDVLAPAGKKVVETKNLVAFLNQTIAKMRTEKPCAAGD